MADETPLDHSAEYPWLSDEPRFVIRPIRVLNPPPCHVPTNGVWDVWADQWIIYNTEDPAVAACRALNEYENSMRQLYRKSPHAAEVVRHENPQSGRRDA